MNPSGGQGQGQWQETPRQSPQAARCGAHGNDQINLTDADSRSMPVSGGGFEQAYNAQAAVDTTRMRLVVPAVIQACNDKEHVVPMLAPATLGKPSVLLSDSGYYSAVNASACIASGLEPLMALKREEHHPSSRARFIEPPPLATDATPAQRMAHMLQTRVVCTAQANAEAGVRHHQIGVGISAILAAWGEKAQRRMDAGVPGVEPDTYGRVTPANRKLSKK